MQKAISTTEHDPHDEVWWWVSCYGVLLFRWKWGFNYKYQCILAQNLQASVGQLRHNENDPKHKSSQQRKGSMLFTGQLKRGSKAYQKHVKEIGEDWKGDPCTIP